MKYRWLQSSVSGRNPVSFQAENEGLLPNSSRSFVGLISNLPASWHSASVLAESDCSLLIPCPVFPTYRGLCVGVGGCVQKIWEVTEILHIKNVYNFQVNIRQPYFNSKDKVLASNWVCLQKQVIVKNGIEFKIILNFVLIEQVKFFFYCQEDLHLLPSILLRRKTWRHSSLKWVVL